MFTPIIDIHSELVAAATPFFEQAGFTVRADEMNKYRDGLIKLRGYDKEEAVVLEIDAYDFDCTVRWRSNKDMPFILFNLNKKLAEGVVTDGKGQ